MRAWSEEPDLPYTLFLAEIEAKPTAKERNRSSVDAILSGL